MTAKTKYLLKIGLYWSLIMSVTSTGLEAWGDGRFELFYSWKFAVKLLIYFFVGVGVGYYNWREKEKAERKG